MKTVKSTLIMTSMLLAAVPTAQGDEIVKVPRENGALHQEFKNMLKRYISQFNSGVGRISLSGKSGSDRCEANFYTNNETTFVTLEVE
ncbi:MAG: hypothetical protein CUN55_19600, partial [Phototrophicales bacterium]